MAYGNNNSQQQGRNNSYSNNKSAAAVAPVARSTGSGSKVQSLFSTGLFTPKKAGSKALAQVGVKEDILIPAGSTIFLFENTKKTSDKSPVYNISVLPAMQK